MRPRTTVTLVILVMGVAGLAPHCNAGPGPGALVLANVVLVAVCWVVAVVIHELAHVGVARAVGIDIAAIVLGTGRLLWTRRWRGVRLRVTSKPWSGFVVLAPTPRVATLPRMLAVFAAGAASNALLVVTLTAIWGDFRPDRWTLELDPRGAAVLANLLVAGFNLLPWKAGPSATDGWRILTLLFRPRVAMDQIARGSVLVRAGQAMHERAWASAREQLLPIAAGADDIARLAQSLVDAIEGEEARAAGDLERERAATRAIAASDQPGMRRVGQVALLLLDLTTPPYAADAQLERARRALAEDPDGDGERLACGAALAASGHFTDARRQLEGAALLPPDFESTRLAFLALAKLGTGEPEAAQTLMERASLVKPDARALVAVSVWAERLALRSLSPARLPAGPAAPTSARP